MSIGPPGIGDNCSGLRALLQVLRALNEANIETDEDILFVGTVGEEGNGDIRGSKFLCANTKLDAFIAVDSTDVGRVLRGAVGSHRWRIAVDGPGGHSFAEFERLRVLFMQFVVQVPRSPRLKSRKIRRQPLLSEQSRAAQRSTQLLHIAKWT